MANRFELWVNLRWLVIIMDLPAPSSDESKKRIHFMFYIFTNDLLPGDANGDFVVYAADFSIWHEHKFSSETDSASGDLNGDGKTDVAGFNVWNDHRTVAATSENVPEPASAAMIALGMLLEFASVHRNQSLVREAARLRRSRR